MSERDICKIQNVSRMTINKAIINLVNEGVLERRQGNEDLVHRNSLYKLYREKYMHKTQKAKQVINPIMLDKTQSKLLNVDLNSLALKIDRVVFTDKEEILEYTSSLFITDKHQYKIILNKD